MHRTPTDTLSLIPADAMDRHYATGHDGAVHEALFNSYTGFLIGLACGASRYQVVHHGQYFDPDRLTLDPPTCPGCVRAISTAPETHMDAITRAYAEAVLTRADARGYPPELDNEGLRLAFAALDITIPGREDDVYYRVYPLIRQHLDAALTARALAVQDGTPLVLAEYTRYTGGKVMAPVGVGDRLMHDGIASGNWERVTVTAVEDTPEGTVVTVLEDDWPHPRRWAAKDLTRWFFKVDRRPRPVRAKK
jgi:hypothetical protein